MKVALVHDWLNGMRGGERCLDFFLKLYPEADIFTMFHQPGRTTPAIDARIKTVSWLNKIPGAARWYRYLLPLYPHAVRQFDFEGYDLVVSLSHAAAKNITPPVGVPHISYCFTPMRYIWDQAQSYFGAVTPLLWPIIAGLRRWDRSGARRTRALVGISRFIAARIRCYYGKDATVIYPPVDTSWIAPCAEGQRGEAFLYAGALVPYKRVDLIVEAFNRNGLPLWIAGSGPLEARLKEIARPNIVFLGRVSDQELAERYARCRALLFPGTEDFGMIPVECLAAGRPVIGIYEGALRETIQGVKPWLTRSEQQMGGLDEEGPCGVFFRRSSRGLREDFIESIQYFSEHEGDFSRSSCIKRAQLFSPARFVSEWNSLLCRLGFPAVRGEWVTEGGSESYAEGKTAAL